VFTSVDLNSLEAGQNQLSGFFYANERSEKTNSKKTLNISFKEIVLAITIYVSSLILSLTFPLMQITKIKLITRNCRNVTTKENQSIFIISQLSKTIRENERSL